MKYAIGRGNEPADTTVGYLHYDHELKIDTVMTSLVFLGAHDKLHCTLGPESDICVCLPNLQRSTLIVKATESGVKLAKGLMTLDQLSALSMAMLPGTEHDIILRVSRTSSIQHLALVGPLGQPKVKLMLDKTYY